MKVALVSLRSLWRDTLHTPGASGSVLWWTRNVWGSNVLDDTDDMILLCSAHVLVRLPSSKRDHR